MKWLNFGVDWLNSALKKHSNPIAWAASSFLIFFAGYFIALHIARSGGYDFSRFVLAKNIAYFSLLGGCVTWYVLHKLNILKNHNFIVFSGIYLFVSVLFLLNKNDNALIYLTLTLIYLFSVYNKYVVNIINNIINKHYFKYIIFFLSIISVVGQYSSGSYLNSESYPQIEIISEAISDANSKTWFEIVEKNKINREILSQNHHILVGSGVKKRPHGFIFLDTKDGIKVAGNIGPDLSIACLFIDDNNKRIIGECERSVGVGNDSSVNEKINYLARLKYINGEYIERIIEASQHFELMARRQFPLFELMYIRGYIFHHYNSIIQGMSLPGIDSFYNQYGFGAIGISKSIGKIFNLSDFDSVYISIYLINALVLLMIVIRFGLNPYILTGFFGTITLIGVYSSILAPFLHTIRLLPIIAIIILKNDEESKYNSLNQFLLYLLFFISGIYSKEYGLLTGVSCLAVSTYFLDKKYLYYGVSVFAGLLAGFIFANKPMVEGANFIAIFLGIGFSDNVGPEFYVWVTFLIWIFYSIYKDSVKDRLNRYEFFLLSVTVLYSVKYVTNPSANHLALLLLIVSFYVASAVKKKVTYANKLVAFFIVMLLFMITSGIPVLLNQKFNLKYNVEYKDAWFSKIFKVDKGLAINGDSLRNLVDEKTCLISEHDDFLQIYLKKNLTGSLPNLSTNINNLADVKRALLIYRNCQNIVVDKSLINNDGEKFMIKKLYNLDSRLNKFLSGHMHSREYLKYFTEEALLNKSVVSENEHFVQYK